MNCSSSSLKSSLHRFGDSSLKVSPPHTSTATSLSPLLPGYPPPPGPPKCWRLSRLCPQASFRHLLTSMVGTLMITDGLLNTFCLKDFWFSAIYPKLDFLIVASSLKGCESISLSLQKICKFLSGLVSPLSRLTHPIANLPSLPGYSSDFSS